MVALTLFVGIVGMNIKWASVIYRCALGMFVTVFGLSDALVFGRAYPRRCSLLDINGQWASAHIGADLATVD